MIDRMIASMIAYMNAMFDYIDFHRRVTNSSIKLFLRAIFIFINSTGKFTLIILHYLCFICIRINLSIIHPVGY